MSPTLLLCGFVILVLNHLQVFRPLTRAITSRTPHSPSPLLFYRPTSPRATTSRLVKLWFALGSVVVLLFSALFLVLLCLLALHHVRTLLPQSRPTPRPRPSLEVDFSSQLLRVPQFLLFLLTLTVSVVFHEFGHFSAAISHGVPVRGVGCLLYGIFPCAFVDLCRETLSKTGAARQMAVHCAGIWHNLVLAVLAYLGLSFTAALWSLSTKGGTGVTVVFSTNHFPVIAVGDVFTAINDCGFLGKRQLRDCLERPWPSSQGFCLPPSFEAYSSESCRCSEGDFCFSVTPGHSTEASPPPKKFCCFRASSVSGRPPCGQNGDCGPGGLCFRVETDFSRGYLFEIARRGANSSFFVGNPLDVFQTVGLSDAAGEGLSGLYLRYFVDFFLQCLFTVSLGLAHLNILPLPPFDGWALYRLGLPLLRTRFSINP